MGTDAADFATFDRLLTQLEDWYADSVQALDYASGPGSPDTGHAILRRNRYPGPDWRLEWRLNPNKRADIIRALEDEIYGLSHAPSRAGPASGLHRGTVEWKMAVGAAEGSLRAVARRFGLSHTEVRRLRLQFGQSA